MTIRNPVEWSADGIVATASALQNALRSDIDVSLAEPRVRRITTDDLRDALAKGFHDFMAYRTDVIFICFIYPLAGLVVARVALDINQLHMLFPLVTGFALIGPCAAAGLYQMSRLREQGRQASWVDAFGLFRSSAIGAMVKLGLILTGIFALWMLAAMGIYQITLGPEAPHSFASFVGDVLTTSRGWAMILLGCGIGFLFALAVLAISAISFPLLIDRRVGIVTAVETSVRALMRNKAEMLTWGAIVAGGLVLGAIPALLGLIVVVPVLGHATWHLYRRVVM